MSQRTTETIWSQTREFSVRVPEQRTCFQSFFQNIQNQFRKVRSHIDPTGNRIHYLLLPPKPYEQIFSRKTGLIYTPNKYTQGSNLKEKIQ